MKNETHRVFYYDCSVFYSFHMASGGNADGEESLARDARLLEYDHRYHDHKCGHG